MVEHKSNPEILGPQTNYDEAVSELERFLGPMDEEISVRPRSERRRNRVEDEVREFGETSIFKFMEKYYVYGNPVVTGTLNLLDQIGVSTTDDLKEFDIESAIKNVKDLGPKRLELVKLMQNVLESQAGLSLESNE